VPSLAVTGFFRIRAQGTPRQAQSTLLEGGIGIALADCLSAGTQETPQQDVYIAEGVAIEAYKAMLKRELRKADTSRALTGRQR
jgi:hypothetical protein